MHVTKKAAVALAAAATLFGGAHLMAGADDAPLPPADGEDQLSEEAIVEDWCELMLAEFHPGGLMPSVSATVDAALAGAVTPSKATADIAVNPNAVAESAADPSAAVATGYLALLEGEPAAIASHYAMVRQAANQALEGEVVTRPDDVVASAAAIDQYLATTCEPQG